ncbi:hypothetical protein PAXINDRAFT_172089 [Paxillus involutus ATCC 200175]|uniref:Uncharacterized protein n=1 Tax=Paxillus involutus ATCC 200175 TaxID=664439 RepID=A0A0C9TSC5_PAXIN|nr:hypothetical protein PAXINDRAFT_172089 [Paxillus involutus ATCC 200175]
MVAPPTSASEWMTYGTFVFGYCSVVPYVLYPRLVLSFKGHRSQSDGLYTGGNAPQHSYSYPAPYGGPGSRVYELMDLNSLGRLSRSTQWSQREGPELVKLPELVHY